MCIVSRDPLRCSELVLSLQASLSPHEDLQIILDRRRDRASTKAKPDDDADRPSIDRRRHLHVDLALKTNGFAIVPATPIGPLAFEEADADERERFERILSFQRRRRAGRWWILAAPVGLVLVLFMLLPPVDSLLHQILPEAPPPSKLTNGLPAVAQAPLVTGLPAEVPNDPDLKSPPAAGRESPEAERPREAINVPRAAPAPTASLAPREVAGAPPEPIARRERVRSAPTSDGRVEAYAARIPEAAGRLLARAKVLLASGADDRVEAYAARISNTAERLVSRAKILLAPGDERVESTMEDGQGP